MSNNDKNKLEEFISGLNDAERGVVLQNIPTEELLEELSRRIKRDRAQLDVIVGVVNAREKY